MAVGDWDTVTRTCNCAKKPDAHCCTWRERIMDAEQAVAVGPVGSGVEFRVLDDEWTVGSDGVWERTIWKLEVIDGSVSV